jgi:hypothetical protein
MTLTTVREPRQNQVIERRERQERRDEHVERDGIEGDGIEGDGDVESA